MIKTNDKKGITLIALVITIIILIILAGVAINLTLGDNGIFRRATAARDKYNEEGAKEKVILMAEEWKLKEATNEVKIEDYLTKEEYSEEREKQEITNVAQADNFILATVKSGNYEYQVEIEVNPENRESEIGDIYLSGTRPPKMQKIDFQNLKYTINAGSMGIDDNGELLISHPGGYYWVGMNGYIDNLPFDIYSKMKITFSSQHGYGMGIAIVDDNNVETQLYDSRALLGDYAQVPKTTETFSIPEGSKRIRLGVDTGNYSSVALRIYEIILFNE